MTCRPYPDVECRVLLEDPSGHALSLVVVADDDHNNLMPKSSLRHPQDVFGRYQMWRRR